MKPTPAIFPFYAPRKPGRPPLVMAHRGGGGLRPENTLEAFHHAMALGADVLEMDARLTRDGHVVVIHDERVDRTTDGAGRVADLSLARIRRLDAGYRSPYRGKGLRIPLFSEALDATAGAPINVDIKDDAPELVAAMARVITARGAEGRVLVASFHHRRLREFRRRCPAAPTSASPPEAGLFSLLCRLGLARLFKSPAIAFQLPEYKGPIRVISPEFIRAARRRGLPVHMWTVNDTADMDRFWAMGVDGLFTDYPDRMTALSASRSEPI